MSEEERRKRMIDKSNEAYAKIMGDPKSRQEELDERAVWDATLADGLDEDEDEDN